MDPVSSEWISVRAGETEGLEKEDVTLMMTNWWQQKDTHMKAG